MKKRDLNDSYSIPDFRRFSRWNPRWKKWKSIIKKVINSLPFTVFHKKLKSYIRLFFFFYTLPLYLYHKSNGLGFSSSILVSFPPPASMHALVWTELECHPARYVMELDVVILFEVPWLWCRARWLWSSMSTSSSSIPGARLGLVHE